MIGVGLKGQFSVRMSFFSDGGGGYGEFVNYFCALAVEEDVSVSPA